MKMLSRLGAAVILALTLFALFGGALSNVAKAQPTTVLYAMKTLYTVDNSPPGNGYFYIPTVPTAPTYLKIEMLFNNPSLTGDQYGGVSPYPTITAWPDGKVDIRDATFMYKAFGSTPTSANWNYMADVMPDQKIDIKDINAFAKNFGGTGTYMLWPQTAVTVVFNNNGVPYSPNSSGFVTIPPSAINFTVYQSTIAIGALVTFWT